MEPPRRPAQYTFTSGGLSSPPATPTSPTHLAPSGSQPSPIYKRYATFFPTTQSPPLDNIEPTLGHHFRYVRSPSTTEHFSRPSTASGPAESPTSRESSPEFEIQDVETGPQSSPQFVVAEQADFRIEDYLEDEPGDSSHLEVVRPDAYEDAESDIGSQRPSEGDMGFVNRFERLSCGESSRSEGEEEEIRRKRARRSKRWSGLIKRSHSKSIEGESESSGTEDLNAHDVGSSARRLRRRIRSPDKRSSLIFDDPPANIVEVEEPDDDNEMGRSIPPDFATSPLEAMPFYTLRDPMEIDTGSSGEFSSEDEE
ncbi:hypothetical protein LTS18_013558 [Coniosporium uncinatum]|uniref:Uncharacterized protein n=1 Tax=Coniosporium uncinatum TaxID=93489 RepID=A0ACC3D903_9PEZI|nr:hypothetical protein LTS18_013558 [Coniosporium uncinatum]